MVGPLQTCHCNGSGWICEDHSELAADACQCGGAAMPCRCNPEASRPEGYESLRNPNAALLRSKQRVYLPDPDE
jgi:hypothetical protein